MPIDVEKGHFWETVVMNESLPLRVRFLGARLQGAVDAQNVVEFHNGNLAPLEGKMTRIGHALVDVYADVVSEIQLAMEK